MDVLAESSSKTNHNPSRGMQDPSRGTQSHHKSNHNLHVDTLAHYILIEEYQLFLKTTVVLLQAEPSPRGSQNPSTVETPGLFPKDRGT